LTETEALRQLFESGIADVYIVSNGYLSRRAFVFDHMANIFYMIGSMGLSLSIGLGLASAQPNYTVAVIEGDGNLLMSLGAIAMVADTEPRNLLHVVVDNQQYASTGGQPSISGSLDICAVALAAKYRTAIECTSLETFEGVLKHYSGTRGPFLVRMLVDADYPIPPRVARSPTEIAESIRALGLTQEWMSKGPQRLNRQPHSGKE
jgi:sulfopyruvate decarboxylase subunit beta